MMKRGVTVHKGKLTPGQNVLWESSRMMLPEHREAFIRQRRDWAVRERPEADEQEQERWIAQLMEAFRMRTPLKVRVWEVQREREWNGIVRAVDPERSRFQLATGEAEQQRVWLSWESLTAIGPADEG